MNIDGLISRGLAVMAALYFATAANAATLDTVVTDTTYLSGEAGNSLVLNTGPGTAVTLLADAGLTIGGFVGASLNMNVGFDGTGSLVILLPSLPPAPPLPPKIWNGALLDFSEENGMFTALFGVTADTFVPGLGDLLVVELDASIFDGTAFAPSAIPSGMPGIAHSYSLSSAVQAQVIPLPLSGVMLGTALVAFAGFRRRRSARK